MPDLRFFIVLAFVLGATVGSFLNVVIYRLPEGLSVVRPRSRCPSCGNMIPGWLNVPILSWVILRGRCHSCRAPISPRYPMIELLTAFLFTASVTRFEVSWAALMAILFSAALVTITFIDIDIWEIPDEISLPGIILGAIMRPIAFDVPWYDGIAGAALGGAILALVRWVYFVVRKQEGMGFGDVKLIAMIGAFVGPVGLIPTILVASLAGSIVGGVLFLIYGKTHDQGPAPVEEVVEASVHLENVEAEPTEAKPEEEEEWVPPPNAVPFGPFLALGGMTQLFLGPIIQRLFLHPW